jgi:hypothetical protein
MQLLLSWSNFFFLSNHQLDMSTGVNQKYNFTSRIMFWWSRTMRSHLDRISWLDVRPVPLGYIDRGLVNEWVKIYHLMAPAMSPLVPPMFFCSHRVYSLWPSPARSQRATSAFGKNHIYERPIAEFPPTRPITHFTSVINQNPQRYPFKPLRPWEKLVAGSNFHCISMVLSRDGI